MLRKILSVVAGLCLWAVLPMSSLSAGETTSDTAFRQPEYMFPNEYDSGIDDSSEYIPVSYFHLLSIPFHDSDRILRVYCEQPCFVDSFIGYWYGYGVQFIDRCRNHEIRITVYDPSTRESTYLGIVHEQHGSNHGGIFMPIALTKDDRNVVFRAWMGSPAAGGGSRDYGYAMAPVIAVTDDSSRLALTVLAPRGALFYDNFGKVVYLDNSDNMPSYIQPGPSHNSGALFSRDLVTGTKSKLLEEENTTYELKGIDTVERTIDLVAIHYVFNDKCPKNEDGYFCAERSRETRTVPLP
ncbi:MAG TPA: hypothetical protein PLF13_08545 [candidate division Zixibacteria bacterium]|nr:hypothetical protein [candidate division Zixibacteria bacterium]